MKPIFRTFFKVMGFTFVGLAIVAAILVMLTSLLTPVVNHHRAELETKVSILLKRPLTVENIKLGWHHFSPEIDLENVAFLDPQSKEAKLKIKLMRVDIGVFASIWHREFIIRNITIVGVNLTITQQAGGEIQIDGLVAFNIKDSQTGKTVKPNEALAWIFSQRRLALEEVGLHLVAPSQSPKFFTIHTFSLKNAGLQHKIDGNITLNQAKPTSMDVHFTWTGDINKHEIIAGDMALNLQDFYFPDWFSQYNLGGLQIKNGLGNVQFTANWKDKQWNKMQAIIDGTNLEAHSTITERSDLIEKVSGTFQAIRKNNQFVLTGDKIQFQFPGRVWPQTHFQITASQDVFDKIQLHSIKTNYLNITDIVNLILDTSFLPSDAFNSLKTLHPFGELKNVDVVFGNSMTDLNQLSAKAEFSTLAFNAWQTLPGVTNFNGTIAWEKNHGNVTIHNNNTSVTIPTIFPQRLHFDLLEMRLGITHDLPGNWSMQAQNVAIQNADLQISGSCSFNIPVDGSPSIDLNTNFKVIAVNHLATYIPLKLLAPDTADWLQQAFRGGSADQGNVVIQGKLADFPFTQGAGKFSAALLFHNLTLGYAKSFPPIEQVNGALSFSNAEMKVDIQSAQLFHFPAKITVNILSKQGQKPNVLANIVGQLTVQEAEQLSQINLSRILKGTLAYETKVRLSSTKGNQVVVNSNLQGLSITAPSGLGKETNQVRNLQISINTDTPDVYALKIRYAKLLGAALTLKKTADQIKLLGGEIKFGSADPQFQKEAGLLISGSLSELDVEKWQTYIDSLTPKKSTHASQDTLALLRNINLTIDILHIAGQDLHKTQINLAYKAPSWLIDLKSTELSGNLILPTVLKGNRIIGHFDYIHLTQLKSASKATAINPLDLPALSIESNDVRVGDYVFDHVTLNTDIGKERLIIKAFTINDGAMEFNASGSWGRSTTQLQGSLTSNNFSQTFKKLGLNAANFIGSTANVKFNLNWNGAPYSPNLASLNGNANFRLGAGKIIGLSESQNAKIGLANLLNIFSLSSFPRFINSTNSSQKGYSFDSLTANFTLRSGNAYTENMIFQGAVASIVIKGRVGLAEKDLNLQMGITPHVSGSLPLVAALAINPVIGVATMAATNVMSSGSGGNGTFIYHVKGPWSKPKLSKAVAATAEPTRTQSQ